MPLNPSAFSMLDTQAPERLAELFNPIRRDEQRNSLADLAVQRETRKMQLTEAQQAQRDRAELKMALEHSGGDYEKMYQFAVQANTPESMAFAQKIKPEVERMRGGSIADKLARERFDWEKGKPPAPNMHVIETSTGQQVVNLNDPNTPKTWGPKPREDKTLVTVIGPDGQTPILVPRSQAGGMTPATGKAGAGSSSKMTPQQLEQASLSSQQAIDQAAKIFSHPGKGVGTGITSPLGGIPGTDAYGFQANLDTFKAQTFLPLVTALKGMGALSDAEGKKIMDSVGALKAGMKTSEFDSNLIEATQFLFNKAKAAGLNVTLPPFATAPQGNPHASKTDAQIKAELGL